MGHFAASAPVRAIVGEIIDASPEWADSAGGSKLVLVLQGALPDGERLQCGFYSGSRGACVEAAMTDGAEIVQWVDAMRLGDQAVRCNVPPHEPGPVAIAIS